MPLTIVLSRLTSAPWRDSPHPLSSIDLVLPPGKVSFVLCPPQNWFCFLGGSSSLTTSEMDNMKQFFRSTHRFSHLLHVGSGAEACNFPLGLMIHRLFCCKFSLATQWCTNSVDTSSHFLRLVTTGKMFDSTWSLILEFLFPTHCPLTSALCPSPSLLVQWPLP